MVTTVTGMMAHGKLAVWSEPVQGAGVLVHVQVQGPQIRAILGTVTRHLPIPWWCRGG